MNIIGGIVLYVVIALTCVGLYMGAILLFTKIPEKIRDYILIGIVVLIVVLALGGNPGYQSDECTETRYYSTC